jgi:Ser/Thr protein kinase RdoA (MazF antagonist)
MPADQAALERHRGVLAREFGIKAARVEEVRGGWSARAFLVETREARYFLKVYDGAQQAVLPWIERIDSYIPVLGWLSKTAQLRGRVVTPVPAPGGGFKVESGAEVYLLFDFVDGLTPGVLNRGQLAELADILARLHALGTEIPVDVDELWEDTSILFCDRLNAFLNADGGAPGDFLRPHEAALKAAIEQTLRLRDTVRLKAAQLSLCHTDAHGNNVIESDRLVLADWEGLCVAPAEADLFMYAGDPNWDAFIGAYRAARPGFELNKDMLRFYQSRRYLEDIWYYLTRLLHDHPDQR